MIDLMGKRYWYFLFSLAIIIPGMILIAIWGLPLSIDFKGGSLLEAQFASGKAPEPAKVVALYQSLGIKDVQVYTSGADRVIVKSSLLDETIRPQILTTMGTTFNDTVTAIRFDNVGPTLAGEVASRGILAVAVSSLLLIVYITLAFRGVQHSFRYGVTTIVALIHDILVMLSAAAIGGRFFGWQVDTLFLTAVLTVIAFSAQDTIVVFDRIRENSIIFRKLGIEKLVNHSIVQTLSRSINTHVMAVDFLLLSLALFGGITLRSFCAILLIGMISGSYSSNFVAAPLLIIWENKEWKNWFKRGVKPTAVPAE
jgi:preprotein translocase subunit SecF